MPRWEMTELVRDLVQLMYNPDQRVWSSEEEAQEMVDLVLGYVGEHSPQRVDENVRIKAITKQTTTVVHGSHEIKFAAGVAMADVLSAMGDLGWEFVATGRSDMKSQKAMSFIFRRPLLDSDDDRDGSDDDESSSS